MIVTESEPGSGVQSLPWLFRLEAARIDGFCDWGDFVEIVVKLEKNFEACSVLAINSPFKSNISFTTSFATKSECHLIFSDPFWKYINKNANDVIKKKNCDYKNNHFILKNSNTYVIF